MTPVTIHRSRPLPGQGGSAPKRDGPLVSLRETAIVLTAGFAIGVACGEFVTWPARPGIGDQVSEFSLPPVKHGSRALASSYFKGTVSLLHVFASRCASCRAEHPLIMEIAAQRIVAVHGLNYGDRAEDAAGWLDAEGDPYTRTGLDRRGRVAMKLGISEPPATLLIGPFGRVIHRHDGPLSRGDFERDFLPLIKSLGEMVRRDQ